MNVDCNYDDKNCKIMMIECCDNENVIKKEKDNQIIDYKENMLIDLNKKSHLTIKNIINGNTIIFLNGASGHGTEININNNTFTLNANYEGMSIYYRNRLICI